MLRGLKLAHFGGLVIFPGSILTFIGKKPGQRVMALP